MKSHSQVDCITNSSSVSYSFPRDDWEKNIKEFYQGILNTAGVSESVDDFYEFKIHLNEDYLDYIIEDLIEERTSFFEDDNSTVGKEIEIFNEFLGREDIDIEDLKNLNYQEQTDFSKKLLPLFNDALQNGIIKLDGWDGSFSNGRFSYIEVTNKKTGETYIFDDKIRSVLITESGNDNY